MILTCEYMQKYYLAVKNAEFEERVVGPEHILSGPKSEKLSENLIYDLPDPQDFIVKGYEVIEEDSDDESNDNGMNYR